MVSRHRDSRSPLLLAAALAVAVPGILVSACSTQASSGTGQNESVTAAGRPATAGRVAASLRRPGGTRAVRLLTQAAQAAIGTSYQGEEVVTRWSGGSGSVLVSDIWHVSGGKTVTRTLDPGASLSSQPYQSSDNDGQSPEGVFGVTAPLLQLLEQHYAVAYAGVGSAGNRTARVVEAWRSDGSIAARFWLDDATKLPLERQVFDSDSHVVSQDVFIDVSFTDPEPGAARAVRADGDAILAGPQGPWTDPLTHTQLLAMRDRKSVV